jgi:hypothetical protein
MGWGTLRVAMAMYVTCQVRSRLFSTGSVMRMKFSKWWAMAADPTRIGDTQLQNRARSPFLKIKLEFICENSNRGILKELQGWASVKIALVVQRALCRRCNDYTCTSSW